MPKQLAEDKIKVRIVEFSKRLIIIPEEPEKDLYKEWYPINGKTCGGSVLLDSCKMLACSEEALDLMETVRRNHDAIGDLGWDRTDNGLYAFSWWGPLYRVVDPRRAEAARDFGVHRDKCKTTPNDAPDEAKKVVKNDLRATSWRQPLFVDYPGPGEEPDDEDEDE